tara:strand:- start:1492 stop:2058 length:567 start_codon:yes stop_codon:yes gene_type:complete
MDTKLTGNIKSIFETPLYETTIENISEVQNELLSAVKDIKFKSHPVWGNTIHLSDPSFTTDTIKENKLSKFKEELHRHIEPYSMNTPFFGNQYQIQNSWFVLMKKNNYSHIHNHGRSDISGVYYVQTSSEDGNIFFESPTQWDNGRITIKPEVGKLLLFPSWLYHGVMNNTTDYPRISLSFNLIFDRI